MFANTKTSPNKHDPALAIGSLDKVGSSNDSQPDDSQSDDSQSVIRETIIDVNGLNFAQFAETPPDFGLIESLVPDSGEENNSSEDTTGSEDTTDSEDTKGSEEKKISKEKKISRAEKFLEDLESKITSTSAMPSHTTLDLPWSSFIGGFYGFHRQHFISSLIEAKHGDILCKCRNKTVIYWSPDMFSMYVLANEIIIRLVMEDMKLSWKQAEALLQETSDYGISIADAIDMDDDLDFRELSNLTGSIVDGTNNKNGCVDVLYPKVYREPSAKC
ncbi:hypothetical protein JCM33374_g4464 [Metschnikowia sp. JCM 33374]|nr:hypothetical protein JCM33374_g4464 [Metschnikowia sp. JCM 33374]